MVTRERCHVKSNSLEITIEDQRFRSAGLQVVDDTVFPGRFVTGTRPNSSPVLSASSSERFDLPNVSLHTCIPLTCGSLAF